MDAYWIVKKRDKWVSSPISKKTADLAPLHKHENDNSWPQLNEVYAFNTTILYKQENYYVIVAE